MARQTPSASPHPQCEPHLRNPVAVRPARHRDRGREADGIGPGDGLAEEDGSSPALPIGIAVAVLALAGGGLWWFLKSRRTGAA
ncbi:hypothetical protein LUR56_26405 [Streptomyces sp. MT29]|nr:hypothetical protein [Streptomyces sp. MT29]